MIKTIHFNRYSYDPFIDYIKGISIIFVILNHCIGESLHSKSFYCLWGDSAVPLFLIIQTFHAYKKGLDVRFSISKIWRRVFKNFILMQLVLVAILAVKDDGGIVHTIGEWFSQGGFGSGSYYVWIYLQFAILFPLCAIFIKKLHGWQLFLFFIVVCHLFEFLFSVWNISSSLYRLICIRYFFLIYLGYMIVKEEGVIMDLKKLLLSLLSAVAIIILYYGNMDFRPIFFTNVSYSWRIFHWISYFYAAYFFILALNTIHKRARPQFNSTIEYLGKYSYEIFLFQMFYFALAQYGTIPFLNGFDHNYSRIIYIIISSTICIATVPCFNIIKGKLSVKD